MPRATILILAFALIAPVVSGVRPAAASPASCPSGALRWSSGANTLYLSGAATVCTPADIQRLHPKRVKKVSTGVYLVKVNLWLQNDARLEVHGTSIGGTTDDLRLLSKNSTEATAKVNITADQGELSFRSTTVRSWNSSAGGPDTEHAKYGRAHIKVRSRLVSGVPKPSRMDIADSDIGYLGHFAAESYGLAWRVMGEAFDSVDVYGDVRNSRIHHNYYGLYTYGAYGMTIDNNEVDSNVLYGIDPHDDSDGLTISNNRSHHNGNHGIICSKRCDRLVVTGNQSYANVGHGIMFHRSVDYSLVEGNTLRSNSDAGIALFESNNNVVRGNHLEGNLNSLRLSVGSSHNRFENNTVASSADRAIYTFKGSDVPERPGNDGINRGNVWIGNTVQNSENFVLRLTATDGDRFEGNDFRGNPGASYSTEGATNTTFANNQTDPGVTLG